MTTTARVSLTSPEPGQLQISYALYSTDRSIKTIGVLYADPKLTLEGLIREVRQLEIGQLQVLDVWPLFFVLLPEYHRMKLSKLPSFTLDLVAAAI